MGRIAGTTAFLVDVKYGNDSPPMVSNHKSLPAAEKAMAKAQAGGKWTHAVILELYSRTRTIYDIKAETKRVITVGVKPRRKRVVKKAAKAAAGKLNVAGAKPTPAAE